MPYKLIFRTCKDHVKPAKFNEDQSDPYNDFSSIHEYELEFDFDERETKLIFDNFGEGQNVSAMHDYVEVLRKTLPNLMKMDVFCFPKIDGDSAELAIANREAGQELICRKFELVDMSKTEKLSKKINNHKSTLGITRFVAKNGFLTAVFDDEVKAGLSEVLDYADYNNNYSKNSKERVAQNLSLKVSKDNGEEESSTNLIEILSELGIY